MIKIRIKIVLLTSASLILPAFNLAYAMDEEDSDSGWTPKLSSSSSSSSSSCAAAAKRRIIVSDDEDECPNHAGGGKSSGGIVDRDNRGAAISSLGKKRKSGWTSESDDEDETNDSDKGSQSESEESDDVSHQGTYYEKLIAGVKSGEHSDRKALHSALGADQSTVIDCFKKALKEKRLTKEEVRPFYTSREDKNALWDGIVSLVKQGKTKLEIFAFYKERCRRGESFSDGQFRRALQRFTEEGLITKEEASPFYVPEEGRAELRDSIALKIRQGKTRPEIFAFYNARFRRGEELKTNYFNAMLAQFVSEGRITHEQAAALRYKEKPIGYQVDTKQLIINFIEEYRLANEPTSSWNELYEKFQESDFSPEFSMAESTFRNNIKKLAGEIGWLDEAQLAFIESCKEKRKAHGQAAGQVKKARRKADAAPGEFKKAPKGALKAFAEEVKSGQYEDREALIAGTGYAAASVTGLFSGARKAGLLQEEEILQFNTVQQNAFRLRVANLIREEKTEKEILAFCQEHEGAREKTEHYLSRNYLRGIIQYLYKEGELTTVDTDYLKLEGTVVNRRGGTKDMIVQFLTTRSQGEPTDTRKELADEFNAFTSREFGMRAIDVKTFATHVRELINKYDRLTPEQVTFFNSCKEQQQQDGYVPTSKRYK